MYATLGNCHWALTDKNSFVALHEAIQQVTNDHTPCCLNLLSLFSECRQIKGNWYSPSNVN